MGHWDRDIWGLGPGLQGSGTGTRGQKDGTDGRDGQTGRTDGRHERTGRTEQIFFYDAADSTTRIVIF